MSFRDLFLTATIVLLLPVCLFRPWIGILVWSWIGYMNPHRLTWGFAYYQPFAMMVGGVTLFGLLFTRDRKRLPRAIEVYVLLLLWGIFVMTTMFALNPAMAWDQLDKVSKILIVTFATMLLFQDPAKLRTLLYVIAASIGFYGLKGGIWALGTGGSNHVLGPPDSFISGNTEIGLAINMVIPILVLLARDEERRWMKMTLRATFVFSIVAVIFTYSRGAVLGLAVILPLMFLKSRAKFIVLPVLIVVAIFGKSMLPEQWLARMGTIQTYEQDRSASMRLNSWYVSYRLAMDNPLTGGGFKPFSPAVYLNYSPDERLNTQQDAHSIYFQVLAEHGFLGLGMYLLLIVCTMVSLRRIMWAAKRAPALAFHYNAAQMIEVSMLGYLVSGAFLSMSYFDLFFHLVAITVMLKVLVLEAHAPAPASASPPLPPRLPVPAMAPRPGVPLRPAGVPYPARRRSL